MTSPSLPNGLRGLVLTAIFGALASSFSTGSLADPSSATITVKYADLDIASPAGARVLYERIRAAAQGACDYFWFKTDADEARCLQNTVEKAVTTVNQPALSAVYRAKLKTSVPRTLVSQSR